MLALLDRLHDYAEQHDLAGSQAHELREIRRREILDKIAELRASKPAYANRARISSAILLLCGCGSVTLYYLLK